MMTKRILVVIFLLLIFCASSAQIKTGVYLAKDAKCTKVTEDLQLEIEKVKGYSYRAYLRASSSIFSPEGTQVEYVYTGKLAGTTLTLYLQHHYSIQDEKLTAKKYHPGLRLDSKRGSSFAFPLLEVRGEKSQTKITIEKIGASRYACKFPPLVYDAEQTARHAIIKKFLEEEIQSAPDGFFDAKDDNEKSLSLYKWSRKLLTSHPEITSVHLNTLVSKKALPYKRHFFKIYRDDLFIPVFGKAFDELSDAELQGILAEMQAISKNFFRTIRYAKKPKTSFFYLLDWQVRMFKTACKNCSRLDEGKMCKENIARELQEQRTAVDIYHKTLSRLTNNEKIPLDELVALRKQFKDQYVFRLWPHEMEQVLKLIEEETVNTADEELRISLEELANRPNTYDKLILIEKAQASDRLEKASPKTRKEIEDQLDRELSLLLDKLMKDERSILEQYAQDFQDPIGKINQWLREFCKKYNCGNENGYDEVQALVSSFEQIKKRLVISEKEAIVQQIQKVDQEDELTDLKRKYLIPFHEYDTIYARLEKLIKERGYFFTPKTYEVISDYTPEEVIEISNETTLTGEPTEAQMRLAYIMAPASLGDVSRLLDEAGIASNRIRNFLLRNAFVIPGYLTMRLVYFSKKGCEEEEKKQGAAFVCECELRVKFEGSSTNGLKFITDLFKGNFDINRYAKVDGRIWMNLESVRK